MSLSIAKTPEALAAAIDRSRPVAFVPTMGALHPGHISLVERAKQIPNAQVVASIFVNPTQFNVGEDFTNYPRTTQEDTAKLEAANIDILFLPELETMYPDGPTSTLSAGQLGNLWEGTYRPGHFDGVRTVVAKLFELVGPTHAIFGEKDYQQLAVIKQMVEEWKLNIEIIGAPTMREADGLAMSSRNVHLSAQERQIAPKLNEALKKVWDKQLSCQQATESLLANGFSAVDYIAIVDSSTLEPLDAPISGARIIAAAWLGKTRLIDNVEIA